MTMIVIPAIDLRNGRCVRLLQGRKSDVTVYNDNPVEVAREFARAGAEIIHVVDLDGAFSEPDSPNRAVVENILRAVDVPIYDFATHTRRTDTRHVEAARVIIVEGILVFTEAALREQHGRDLRLVITVGQPPRPTPAEVRRANESARMREAREAIETDPNVKAVQGAFDATLEPDSIRFSK